MRTKYAESDAPLKSNAGTPSAPGSIDRFAAPAAPHSRRRFGKLLTGIMATPLKQIPAFPQAFRETVPAAIRKLRCADGLALQCGRASGGTPRQPPRIPDSVSGNTSRRNPKAAMCGRSCFSVRQGERRKSPHFTLPAAPHSRRCFGKPLPPQTESCDVRTALLFSAAGRAHEWDRRCRFTAG